MKILLEELMTISCKALKENAEIDNCKNTNGSSQVQDSMDDGVKHESDTSLKNSTIQFGKKLEHFYTLSDAVQMSLKQAKEQLMVTHFYVANMPTPSNVNKDSYQAYVDTVKCQINDAKQVHNIFKDLSNKLKFPSYSTDLFKEEEKVKGVVGLGQAVNNQLSNMSNSMSHNPNTLNGQLGMKLENSSSMNSQNSTLKNEAGIDVLREVSLTPAVTVEYFDYGSVLVHEDKVKKDKESRFEKEQSERLNKEREEAERIKRDQERQRQQQQNPGMGVNQGNMQNLGSQNAGNQNPGNQNPGNQNPGSQNPGNPNSSQVSGNPGNMPNTGNPGNMPPGNQGNIQNPGNQGMPPGNPPGNMHNQGNMPPNPGMSGGPPNPNYGQNYNNPDYNQQNYHQFPPASVQSNHSAGYGGPQSVQPPPSHESQHPVHNPPPYFGGPGGPPQGPPGSSYPVAPSPYGNQAPTPGGGDPNMHHNPGTPGNQNNTGNQNPPSNYNPNHYNN